MTNSHFRDIIAINILLLEVIFLKALKPLLWFLVPTILIWASYFLILLFIGDGADVPRFSGADNYLKLFMQDKAFLLALGNTLKITLIPALVVSIVTYIFTLVFKAKTNVMYAVIFVISALVCMFARYFLFNIDFYFNPFDIFGALQCGVVCCFICFIINIFFKKVIKKQNIE